MVCCLDDFVALLCLILLLLGLVIVICLIACWGFIAWWCGLLGSIRLVVLVGFC